MESVLHFKTFPGISFIISVTQFLESLNSAERNLIKKLNVCHIHLFSSFRPVKYSRRIHILRMLESKEMKLK